MFTKAKTCTKKGLNEWIPLKACNYPVHVPNLSGQKALKLSTSQLNFDVTITCFNCDIKDLIMMQINRSRAHVNWTREHGKSRSNVRQKNNLLQ